MIVEDEDDIAMGLQGDLEIEGYKVVVARDGEKALELVAEEVFDLIILDIMLPGLDGYEVCQTIRQQGSQTPIIMLTAKAAESEKILGLDLGADDYITKPFSPMELRARINAVMRRTRGDDNSIYRFDDFEVDMKRFELRHKGKLLRLTPTEFKLLSTFTQHPGQVLSRDCILDLVWGDDVFVTDRVIDTHITNLRKKIEIDGTNSTYIESIRGIGYRFDV